VVVHTSWPQISESDGISQYTFMRNIIINRRVCLRTESVPRTHEVERGKFNG
jgi:hypothetical protein